MKNVFLTAAFASTLLFVTEAKAQNPLPTVGPWLQNTGVSQTQTVHNTGVGTTNPDGKMEVKYQPCITQQNGLVVTSLGCTVLEQVYNVAPTDGLVIINLNDPIPPYVPVPIVFLPAFANTTAAIPLVSINKKPMFWVRDENPPLGLPGTPNQSTYNTKFIILPNGNTGINTNNPRATLDVVQPVSGYKNEPTAVFGKIVAGTQTQLIGGENNNTPAGVYGYRTAQVMIYNKLASKIHNRIVQDLDQAILFTDGQNTDGSNQNGALVIAPWAADYTLSTSTIGGIRIDKQGDVEVHGRLRATYMVVNPKWWSDFVFAENYNLLGLDSVKTYIQSNGHLPGMPSEQEVMDCGINVADMQALQQQKLEELTLYAIGQDEMISTLKALIEAQQKKLAELEAKLELVTK